MYLHKLPLLHMILISQTTTCRIFAATWRCPTPAPHPCNTWIYPNANSAALLKNIRRIYGRIAGNQLPGHVPLFLRESVKIVSHGMIETSKCYLRQHSDISCNNINMSTHFYPLPRSSPYKIFTGPVKVTVNALADGCHLFYRKIYGHVYSVEENACYIHLFII